MPDGVVFHNVDKKTGRVGGSFPEAFLKGTRPPAAPAPAEPAPVEEVMEPPSELIPAQEPGEIPLLADI